MVWLMLAGGMLNEDHVLVELELQFEDLKNLLYSQSRIYYIFTAVLFYTDF